MIVTKFHYPMEPRLLKKIDIQIKRCTQTGRKLDSVMLVEGPEGEGKTTLSVAIAYYIAEQTGRKFSTDNIFFDAQKMMDFLKSTDSEIIIWDEPALHMLSKDSMSKIVKNVERLLMMSRKKRHFIILNIAYFNRFNDYIIWQRPRGMIHIYNRDGQPRFIYIRKKFLEKLWQDWRKKRIRNYFKYACKFVRGTFPDVLNPDYANNVLSEFNINKYEQEKDKAISSVGVEEDKRDIRSIRREWCINVIRGLEEEKIKIKQDQLSSIFGVNKRVIQRYAREIRETTGDNRQIILNKGIPEYNHGIPEPNEEENISDKEDNDN